MNCCSAQRVSASSAPAVAAGIEGGRGHAPLQLARDQVGVAPDVGAVLQHRRAAIAAGQRRQLGLGQDRRDFDAPPGQALEAQHQPRFLCEIGEIVVVKDQFTHDNWAEAGVTCNAGRGQHRRSAQAGQETAAQDRLRLHRGRHRRRGRARHQRAGLPPGAHRAALPGRRLRARPVDDALRPHLFEPDRHRADRPCRPVPPRRRPDAGRGRARRQRALHHVGLQHRLDRGSRQARARPRLVPALLGQGPGRLRGHDQARGRRRPAHARLHRRRARGLQPRAQHAQRLGPPAEAHLEDQVRGAAASGLDDASGCATARPISTTGPSTPAPTPDGQHGGRSRRLPEPRADELEARRALPRAVEGQLRAEGRSCIPTMPSAPSRWASTASWCRTTARASSTSRRRRWRCCRPSATPSATR